MKIASRSGFCVFLGGIFAARNVVHVRAEFTLSPPTDDSLCIPAPPVYWTPSYANFDLGASFGVPIPFSLLIWWMRWIFVGVEMRTTSMITTNSDILCLTTTFAMHGIYARMEKWLEYTQTVDRQCAMITVICTANFDYTGSVEEDRESSEQRIKLDSRLWWMITNVS